MVPPVASNPFLIVVFAMSDPPSSVTRGRFLPKELVQHVVGSKTCYVYPRLNALMPIEEKAYGFWTTTTSLKDLRLPNQTYIDQMGQLLDSGTTVAGLKHDMDHHFTSHWHDFNHLTILSWHNSTGAAMANAATAADINILKPVQNGPVPDCRPDDVKFVRVRINLDYRDLCTDATPEDNTILRAEYFFELPQTSVEVLNGAGNPRMLTTFHGAADLRTLSAAEFKDQILHHVPHEGPITLADAPFGVANASIDDTSAMEIIEKLYLKIALPTIENSVFRTLCPGYTNKPHAALEGLCQSVKDEEGNVTTVTVSQYFAMIQNATRTFANMDEYPVDVCRIFIDGLHEDVKGFFVDLYPEHAAPHPLNARSQRKSMETIPTKPTPAETRVLSTNRLIAR